MTQGMLAALEAQSRAAILEADDALLATRSACMISVLQHKLPAKALGSASMIAIFPELLTTTQRSTGVPGLCVELKNGVPAQAHVVNLEGAGIDLLRLPGGLVMIATERAVGQAILAGCSFGTEIPVVAAPLKQEDLPDESCLLCWFFLAGDVRGATVTDVAARFDHTPSHRTVSSLLKALSTAVRRAQDAGRRLKQPIPSFASANSRFLRCPETC